MTEVIEKKEEQQPKKNLVINRYTLWTIPNILVFIRILCVPVYMTLIILSAKPAYAAQHNVFLYTALGIIIFAAFTDVLDGKIARKYKAGTKIGKYVVKHDQGTYVGQCIDPIADKAMHIGAVVALSVGGYLHWAFIILLVLREACMIIIGSFLVNDVNIKANMLGKVASATISCGVFLCFFHNYFIQWWQLGKGFAFDWLIVAIGLVLNWAAAINYAVDVSRQIKAKKAADAAATLAENASESNETEEK